MLGRRDKSFTLIELMVVVVIIGVLVVLGLRAYFGQVEKARIVVTRANVSTIQFFIQAELIDETVSEVNSLVGSPGADSILITSSGIHNPFTGEAQIINGVAGASGNEGDVYVTLVGDVFYINGNGTDGLDVFVDPLRATK
jgi:prepilin-type N-terminal cleavage/methylation domain-containing protein